MGFVVVTLAHKVEDVFVKIKECGLQSTKRLYDVVLGIRRAANMVELKLKDAKR